MAKESQEFKPSFSLLKPSAQALFLNIWTFLVFYAIGFAYSILDSFNGSSEPGQASPLAVLFFIVNLLIAPAITITMLKSARGEEIAPMDAFRAGMPFVVRIFFLQILSILIVLGGFILLVVPGFFAIQRLLMAPYLLIDKDLSISDAIKESFKLGKEYSGPVWGLIGVFATYALLIFTIFLIPVAIALFVAYSVAPAIRYLEVKKAAKA